METMRFIVRALRYRNYRLFFAGQSISLVGTWLQLTALPWLVYRLTESAFLLGVVGFLSQIPTFLLTPVAGVLIDRMDRRRLLLVTQVASMLQAFLLWLLLVSQHMSVPAVLVLSFILGIINAFDIPARHAFIVDMVENREDLGNAIALNSSMVHAARLIGPAIAGVLIGAVGESSCFLLNSLSFLAVIASLLKMNLRPVNKASVKDGIWKAMQEGFSYVRGNLPMRAIMVLMVIISMTGMPYIVFMPIFAKDIFHGTPHTLGFLIGASGLGAFIGAIYLASRQGIKGLGRIMAGSSVLFGLGLMAFSLSTHLWLSWGCMVLVGFGMMIQFAASNTILQTIVDDTKRGRVMSLYTVAFMGMTPIGSLVQGYLAHRWGVSMTVFAGGFMCLLASLNFAKNLPQIRQAVQRHRQQSVALTHDPISS